MSLNPSNAVAEQVNGGHKVFPNLARRVTQWHNNLEIEVMLPDAAETFAQVDAAVEDELKVAGLQPYNDKANMGIYKREWIRKTTQPNWLLAAMVICLKCDIEHGGQQVLPGELADFLSETVTESPEKIVQYREVPTSVIGFAHRWKFERRWYYYSAEGPGIPPEFAVPFDKEWGKQVRAEGDGACRGAVHHGQGFGIGMYHIDTQAGLNAFIALLKKIHRPRKDA